MPQQRLFTQQQQQQQGGLYRQPPQQSGPPQQLREQVSPQRLDRQLQQQQLLLDQAPFQYAHTCAHAGPMCCNALHHPDSSDCCFAC